MDPKYEKCQSPAEDCNIKLHSSFEYEKERLLLDDVALTPPTKKASWRWRYLLTHILYFFSWLLVVLAALQIWGSRPFSSQLTYSPAQDAISYIIREPQPLWDGNDKYVGDPSPEKDQAWLELIQYTPIVLYEEEFARFKKDGVKLKDDSGYLSALTVYHELHCLRKLHRLMYPEYFAPNQTHGKWLKVRSHAQHCLKILLESITCHSDITVRTMQWSDDDIYPTVSNNPRQCRDFSKIDEWAKSRSVEPWAPGLLIHPKLGPSFPEIPDPDVEIAGVL